MDSTIIDLEFAVCEFLVDLYETFAPADFVVGVILLTLDRGGHDCFDGCDRGEKEGVAFGECFCRLAVQCAFPVNGMTNGEGGRKPNHVFRINLERVKPSYLLPFEHVLVPRKR